MPVDKQQIRLVLQLFPRRQQRRILPKRQKTGDVRHDSRNTRNLVFHQLQRRIGQHRHRGTGYRAFLLETDIRTGNQHGLLKREIVMTNHLSRFTVLLRA